MKTANGAALWAHLESVLSGSMPVDKGVYNTLLRAARKEMWFLRRYQFDALLGIALGRMPRANWTNHHVYTSTVDALNAVNR